MHEEAAHPVLLHVADLAAQFLGFEPAVPRPEGRPAELVTWIKELLLEIAAHACLPASMSEADMPKSRTSTTAPRR